MWGHALYVWTQETVLLFLCLVERKERSGLYIVCPIYGAFISSTSAIMNKIIYFVGKTYFAGSVHKSLGKASR